MYCANCEKDLSQCTCPDLAERIARLKKSPYVHIIPDLLAVYEAQARRNKANEQKVRTE